MIDYQLRDWPSFRRQFQPKLFPQSLEDRREVFGFAGIAMTGKKVVFRQGCNANDNDTSMIAAAVKAAKGADVAVLAVGETADMSGEAASRANIGLPGVELQLVHAVAAVAKKTVVVLINGRPLTIAEVLNAS